MNQSIFPIFVAIGLFLTIATLISLPILLVKPASNFSITLMFVITGVDVNPIFLHIFG